jgi:hypothetical protein
MKGLKWLRNWAAYGPLYFAAGTHRIVVARGVAGPLVSYSTVSNLILANHVGTSGGLLTNLEPQRISAGDLRSQWLELKTTFDGGWTTASAKSHLIGDGLFNLFQVPADAGARDFTFATNSSEYVGVSISAGWTVLVLLLAWVTRRIEFLSGENIITSVRTEHRFSLIARTVGIAGLLLLAIGAWAQAAAWLGIPSRYPDFARWFPLAGVDPYGTSELYVTLAIILLGTSTLLHLLSFAFGRR